MFVFWTHNNDVKRRMFGKKVRRFCTKCNQEATFYECDINNSVKILGVFALWDKHESVLQCGECLALFKTDEQIFDDENAKPPEQQGKDRVKRQEDEKRRQSEEAKRLAEEERRRAQEQVRQEAEAAARLAEERQSREAALDAELAELKKKMGK